MRLSKKDQLDREKIKILGIGDTVTIPWLANLTKPARRKLDRKLERHGLELRRAEMDGEWIIAKQEGIPVMKEKTEEKKEEKVEEKEEPKKPRYYESDMVPKNTTEKRYYESGKD